MTPHAKLIKEHLQKPYLKNKSELCIPPTAKGFTEFRQSENSSATSHVGGLGLCYHLQELDHLFRLVKSQTSELKSMLIDQTKKDINRKALWLI